MTVMWPLLQVLWDSGGGRAPAVMSLFRRRQRMRGNYFSEVNIALRFPTVAARRLPPGLRWQGHSINARNLMSCLSPSNHRFSPVITKQNQKASEAREASSKECFENYEKNQADVLIWSWCTDVILLRTYCAVCWYFPKSTLTRCPKKLY